MVFQPFPLQLDGHFDAPENEVKLNTPYDAGHLTEISNLNRLGHASNKHL